MNRPHDLNQQRWGKLIESIAIRDYTDEFTLKNDYPLCFLLMDVAEAVEDAVRQEPQEHPDTARINAVQDMLKRKGIVLWYESPTAMGSPGHFCIQKKESSKRYRETDFRAVIDAAMNGECDEPSADVTDETPVPYQFKGVSDLTIIELRLEAATKGISPTDRHFVEECDAELKRREKERDAQNSTNEADTPTSCASARQVLAQESTRMGVGEPSTATMDDGGGEGKTVLDFWYDRAQKAEARVADLESQLSERDDALSEIRARSSEHGMGIVATSELAAAWRKRQQEGE